MSIGFFTKIFPGFLKSFSSRNKNARICVHLFLFVVFGGGTFSNQSLPGDTISRFTFGIVGIKKLLGKGIYCKCFILIFL